MSVKKKLALSLKVEKQYGEMCRKVLKKHDLLNPEMKISVRANYLYFPLKESGYLKRKIESILSTELDKMGLERMVLLFEEREFTLRKNRKKEWREILAEDKKFPKHLLTNLPTSFDIIGHILIIKLEPTLLPYRKKIAEALLLSFPNIRTVALEEKVGGEFRIRNLSFLAGERKWETVHKEHGLRYLLNPKKVYFSPRLAAERLRVAEAVESTGEVGSEKRVLDMFAGVGPFSLLIAKRAGVEKVVAFDKNPKAIEYLNKNIKLNKINNVEAHLGDSNRVAESLLKEKKFHFIIMNFPSEPEPFFPSALTVAESPCTIYFYKIAENSEMDSVKHFLKEKAESLGKKVESLEVRKVRTYSPTSSHYLFEVKIVS
ncbi:MAG TPA: class I SAM-dependent methyltransferase family protein [Thermoplasmata archaeon]|nr:class I SAM-dependent methyltransferase family protein [Thermoplasmata archaeon]